MNFHFQPGFPQAFQQFLGEIVHDDADKAGVIFFECFYIGALENKQFAVMGCAGGEAVAKGWDQGADADAAVFGSDHGDGNFDVLIDDGQKLYGAFFDEVEVPGFLILAKKPLPFLNRLLPGNCKNTFELSFRETTKQVT